MMNMKSGVIDSLNVELGHLVKLLLLIIHFDTIKS